MKHALRHLAVLALLALVGLAWLSPSGRGALPPAGPQGPGAVPPQPADLVGKVVGVSDGDTLTLLVGEKLQEKIRLAKIDAPESKQPFGQKAKQALSDKVFGRQVRVVYKERDQYQRIIGTVWLEGREINLEMIKAGLAWHYRTYDQTLAYAEAEAAARQAKLGLWTDRSPVPPWEFRRQKRTGKKTSVPSTPEEKAF